MNQPVTPPMTEQHSAHERCDILIIGAGPAGLAAALAAAPSGAAITVVDDNPQPGGQIWRDGPRWSCPPWRSSTARRWPGTPTSACCLGTRVVGLGDSQPGDKAPALLLEDADRGWTQHSHRIVLCTGARELLLPFPGWTLPGVTGAGALQALIKAGLDVRGQRIVIAGTGPLLLAAAATANKAGATVVRVAEQAPWSALAGFAAQLPRWPAKALQALTLLHPQLRASSHVLEVQGTTQVQVREAAQRPTRRRNHGLRPRGLRVRAGAQHPPGADAGLRPGRAAERWPGPGCRCADAHQRCPVCSPRVKPPALAAANVHWFRAPWQAHVAAGQVQQAQALRPQLARWEGFAQALQASFPLNEALKTLAQPGTLVCRCEDVPYAALADRDGWIDAKLHTRCGMGACQGRICGAATQHLFGWTPAAPTASAGAHTHWHAGRLHARAHHQRSARARSSLGLTGAQPFSPAFLSGLTRTQQASILLLNIFVRY